MDIAEGGRCERCHSVKTFLDLLEHDHPCGSRPSADRRLDEGCTCHQEDLEELGARRWRDLFRKRVDESACPMKVHG